MDRKIILMVMVALTVSSGEGHYFKWGKPDNIERELERFFKRDETFNCGKKPADIVFVLDESGSIWAPHFTKQLEFVSNVMRAFDVEFNQTHFGVMTFSTDPIVHFQLTEHHNYDELKTAVEGISQRRGQTHTHLALAKMWEEMFSPQYSRSWVPHIGVVITDGASHYKDRTTEEAENARAQGITMFAIGVGTNISKQMQEELANIANKPTKDYVFNVSDYDALNGIRDKLANRTCKVTTTTTTTTTPIPTTTIISTTLPPQSIERCMARGPIDVIFALPDQAGVADTELVLDFVDSLSTQLEMGEEQALIGLTPRSCDDVAEEILLEDNDVIEGLRNSLSHRRLTNTETWRHLRYMHTSGMKPASGSREDAVRFGVLVIDNKSPDAEQTLRQAGRAKDSGIHLIAIMVGSYPDEQEVRGIASSEDDWFTADDYSDLDGLVDGIIDRFCTVILHGNYGY